MSAVDPTLAARAGTIAPSQPDSAVRTIGRRYRDTVLALGGSRPPEQIFRAFRGFIEWTKKFVN